MFMSKTTILLIEDHPADVRLTQEFLCEQGHDWFVMVHANRLDTALDHMTTRAFDVVLVDVHVPDSTGLPTFTTIQDAHPGVPVIILSGLHDERMALQAMQSGAQDYLMKGHISGDALRRVIKYAIERKRLEEQYRTLVGNIPGAVYRGKLEQDWTMLFISTPIQDILGHPASDLVGPDACPYGSFFIHPDDRERTYKQIRAAIAARTSYHVEYRVIDANGMTRWVSDQGQGRGSADGTTQWLDGILLDMTGRKHIEDELRRREDQLRRSQKMEAIGGLAAGLAHDFNNVFTVINGHADLLLIDMDSEDPHRLDAEQIKKAGGRAVALTRQLKSFTQRHGTELKVLDVNLLLTEMTDMIRWLLGGSIELTVRPDPLLGRIKVDHAQFSQVILILAVNARHHMPAGGLVTIETENIDVDPEEAERLALQQPGSYVLVTVHDTRDHNGVDPEADLAEPVETNTNAGSGLGLSTVSYIVVHSRGQIVVSKEDHQGMTYRMYLPRAEIEMAVLQSMPPVDGSVQGNETVLLVEDEEMIRSLARTALVRHGYTVLAAEDGHEALRLAETHPGAIHLLISDAVMPGMSGGELAQHVLTLRPLTKVLFMSGYAGNPIIHNGLLTADSSMLAKPFSTEALSALVQETLHETPPPSESRHSTTPLS